MDTLVRTAACAVLLGGCVGGPDELPWDVPPGTPQAVVDDCREQAALVARNERDRQAAPTLNDMAGGGDEAIAEARVAKEIEEGTVMTAEDVFNSCLESHGITLPDE